MANLRVKHNQIYSFPLQQNIEPQVNWSTVIEEKQVPRAPTGPLPGQQHQLGRTSLISPWRTSWQPSGQLSSELSKEHGQEVGC